jgi:hypothetical protein
MTKKIDVLLISIFLHILKFALPYTTYTSPILTQNLLSD